MWIIAPYVGDSCSIPWSLVDTPRAVEDHLPLSALESCPLKSCRCQPSGHGKPHTTNPGGGMCAAKVQRKEKGTSCCLLHRWSKLTKSDMEKQVLKSNGDISHLWLFLRLKKKIKSTVLKILVCCFVLYSKTNKYNLLCTVYLLQARILAL